METEVKDHQDVAEPGGIVSGTAGTGQEDRSRERIFGDTALYLYDREDRTADRLTKKIRRLEKRVSVLEERGRS